MEMTNDQTRNWLPGKTQQIQNSQSPSEVQQEPREGGHHQVRQESGGDEDISGCEGVHLSCGVSHPGVGVSVSAVLESVSINPTILNILYLLFTIYTLFKLNPVIYICQVRSMSKSLHE